MTSLFPAGTPSECPSGTPGTIGASPTTAGYAAADGVGQSSPRQQSDPAAAPVPPPQGQARPPVPVDPAAGEPFITLPTLGPARYRPLDALGLVAAARLRQIEHFGHTLETDLAAIEQHGRLTIGKAAQQALKDGLEAIHFNQDLAIVERRLAKAAALILATLDTERARRAKGAA